MLLIDFHNSTKISRRLRFLNTFCKMLSYIVFFSSILIIGKHNRYLGKSIEGDITDGFYICIIFLRDVAKNDPNWSPHYDVLRKSREILMHSIKFFTSIFLKYHQEVNKLSFSIFYFQRTPWLRLKWLLHGDFLKTTPGRHFWTHITKHITVVFSFDLSSQNTLRQILKSYLLCILNLGSHWGDYIHPLGWWNLITPGSFPRVLCQQRRVFYKYFFVFFLFFQTQYWWY